MKKDMILQKICLEMKRKIGEGRGDTYTIDRRSGLGCAIPPGQGHLDLHGKCQRGDLQLSVGELKRIHRCTSFGIFSSAPI
jgi:hypothetical protein